jgi:hypothetical protein
MSGLLDRTIEPHGGLERWRGVMPVTYDMSGKMAVVTDGAKGHREGDRSR